MMYVLTLFTITMRFLSATDGDKTFHVIPDLCLLCFRGHLFIDALWSPTGKGLTSSLSFVMSNRELITFPLVSWVRCGT